MYPSTVYSYIFPYIMHFTDLQIENKDYLETDLKELVNMESGSNFMNMKESFYIKTEQNKKGVRAE